MSFGVKMDWAHSNQSPAPRQILISFHRQSFVERGLRTEWSLIVRLSDGEKGKKPKESE